MFKAHRPIVFDISQVGQFPHCDQRVLHAPRECQYCDKHADWQALRAAWESLSQDTRRKAQSYRARRILPEAIIIPNGTGTSHILKEKSEEERMDITDYSSW